MEHSISTYLPPDLIVGTYWGVIPKQLEYFELNEVRVPCHFYFQESEYSPHPVVGYYIDSDFENENEIQQFLFADNNKERRENSLLEMMFKGGSKEDYAVCIRTPNQIFLLRSILQNMMTWELMDDWKEIFRVLAELR
jgi:hypothetical protein